MSYRIINSGKNARREYWGKNRSPLFQDLPNKDFGQEQKLSYDNFLHSGLEKLITNYFPATFSNYNNSIQCAIKQFSCREPKKSEEEVRSNSQTWSYEISFDWVFTWNCQKISIRLFSDKDFVLAVSEKIEKKLTGKKELSKQEKLKLISWQEKIKEFLATEEQSEVTIAEISLGWWLEESFKIRSYNFREKIAGQQWEVKEKKGKLKITLDLLEKEENNLIVKFCCVGEKEVIFCHLPKITSQGNFIINGHDRAVIFQSIRAPAVYFFTSDKEQEIYGEIIPFKGPWLKLAFSKKRPGVIELKFLNSGLVINFWDLLKTFDIKPETLNNLFNKEDLNLADYSQATAREIGIDLPQLLFTKPNSYFVLGQLGRKKFNQKSNLCQQVIGQTLAEDLFDINGKLLLECNTILQEKNLEILTRALTQKKITPLVLPYSTSDLYRLKIKAPTNPQKTIFVLGFAGDLAEEKTYFDLADLICVVSLVCNLTHGLGNPELETEKDKLENQVIRRVGDLIYKIFEDKLSNFLHHLSNKYLAYLSQFKKADFTKIPNLKDFDNLLRNFFHTSPLVQLQNQNNPLAEIAYTQKLSVLGFGGFSSSNTTFAARNINTSYHGRYDLVETPEGQQVGLIHNLTLGAKIDDYGQITVPYYQVQARQITSRVKYLTSEEEWDKYIVHCNIKITADSKIQDEKVLARFRNDFVWVATEQINYIDTSFYQLNSITSATIPFFQHNDATRMLMATNMQRQAVPLLRNQEPWVASGVENNLAECSPLVLRAEKKGLVDYVDSQQVVIKESARSQKIYPLKQLVVSNKNILNFSTPTVKKGERVEKGQIIANGCYTKNNELALGYNLRVAYCCWKGYNFEDAIVLSERLVKEDILTSLFVKKYVVIRHNTKYGEENFTTKLPYLEPEHLEAEKFSRLFSHLDKNGFVKIGSEVKEHDILVGKTTPQPRFQETTAEESLLLSILGEKTRRFVDSSLYLPAGEKGIVYDIRRKKFPTNRKKLELVEIYIAQARKIEVGDKLTTRFGNKGVVAKIVPEVDMPFDENGQTVDIIFNPLSVPSRMNIGQLLETILAEATVHLNSKLLVRPFNTPSRETIHQIIREANIKNYGARKLFDGQTGLPFQHDIYTGYIYTVKLNHMVADKFHVRNTGPYSLIYQQPLKGRSQEGGQRVGEMEVWALEAHGAAYNLMEMMSAKSDDIYKRRLAYNSLILANRQIDLQSSQNESFNLLIQYLRGIGFDLQATDYYGKEINFYHYFSRHK